MIRLDLIDFEERFRLLKREPLMLNDIDVDSLEDKERLNRLISSTYSGDTLEDVASCECGAIVGDIYRGSVCPECRTEVTPDTERPLESILWARVPPGVKAFFNPRVYTILSENFKTGKADLLNWMVKPRYVPETTPQELLILKDIYEQKGFKRGLNYFVEHFDDIIPEVINSKAFKPRMTTRREELQEFIDNNRDKLFTTVLPMPSKALFATEKTPVGNYADETGFKALDGVLSLARLQSTLKPLSTQELELKTVQAVEKLCDYYNDFVANILAGKKGWGRQQLFGTRCDFTFRGVITSIHEPHHHTELHMPWSMSVTLLRQHIYSKLKKKGFSPNECAQHVNEHTARYDPLLDSIMQELIDEGMEIPERPGVKGLVCLFQRNLLSSM